MADKDAYDRQLDHHRRAFHTARQALGAELGILTTAKEVEDLLISRAEEYGFEHTLEALVMSPKDLQLDHAPSPEQMAIIKPLLKAAYESNAAMDKLLDERERAANGSRYSGSPTKVQLFGREVTFDPDKETIRYADTGEVKSPTLVTVRPRPKLKMPDKTRER
jgi:hypothetical protein